MVRFGEEEIGLQVEGDIPVSGKLTAIIGGQGEDFVLVRHEAFFKGRPHIAGGLAGDLRKQGVFGEPLNHAGNDAFLPCADDGVQLPITDASFLVHDCGPVVNIHPAGDQPCAGPPPDPPLVAFAAVAQVFVQSAARFAVRANVLINPLVADFDAVFLCQAARNLDRAPFQHQLAFDAGDQIRAHLPRTRIGAVAASGGLVLRGGKMLAVRTGVSFDLPPDGRAVTAKLFGNGLFRHSALQQPVNVAPFFCGEVGVVLCHRDDLLV